MRPLQPVARETPSALASFIANPPEVSAATADRAKKVFADTFAAMLAGVTSEAFEPLAKYVRASGGEGGDYPVFGSRVRTTDEFAALVNGTLGAALEFDDVLSIMPGHPSAVVIPALCSFPAALSSDGAAVLKAYAVGIETGARLAQAITLDHYKRGFHVTGTIAMFSAVAALGCIGKLSPRVIDRALGIAASFSSGIQGNFGTMTKPLHSGWAAKNALAAVNMARNGFTASENIFETQGGFFDAYGAEGSNLAGIESRLGKPWVFDEPGVTLKLYPCCYATHRGIDAMLELKRKLDLTPDNVRKVECKVPPGGLVPLKFQAPKDRFESLFSMPYSLAVSLLHERPVLRSFTEAQVTSPEVARLLAKIDAHEDESVVASYPDYQQMSYGTRGEVQVSVETTDGRTGSHTIVIAPGHPKREVTWEQMRDKFSDCASAAGFEAADAGGMSAALFSLEKAPSFGNVVKLFSKP